MQGQKLDDYSIRMNLLKFEMAFGTAQLSAGIFNLQFENYEKYF